MPSRSYPLTQGEEPRLTVRWEAMWKGTVLLLDGEEIGRIEDRAALLEGKRFSLEDGSELSVKLERGLGGVELLLLRDGVPLPGSGSDPERRVKAASMALFLVAGLILLLGLLGGGAGPQGGSGAFVTASAYGLLGWWVRFRRSLLALVVGMVFLVGNAGLMIHQSMQAGHGFPVALTLAHLLLLAPMARAIGAVRTLGPRIPDDEPKGTLKQ